MRYVQRLLIFFIFVISLSCTNAIPVSTSSSSGFNAPTFSGGQTQKTYLISVYNASVAVSGECDPKTQNIKMSLDNGNSWQDPPTAGADLDCSNDGLFNFTITDSSISGPLGATYGFTSGSPMGSKITIQLRSEAAIANSAISTFYIQYGNSINARFANITSGGGTIVGSQFIVKSGQIGLPTSTQTINSFWFKLHLSEGN